MSYSRHLATGLRILGERRFDRPRRWVLAPENDLLKLVRVAILGVPGYVLWRVVSSSWRTLGVAVLVVVVLALRAATKAVKAPAVKPETAAAAPDEPPQQGPEDAFPAVPRDVFLPLLHDLLGVAQGVHLRTLAAALTARHGGTWDVPAVRRLCEAHEVPVRPTVRAPGGGPTVGVHRDDLTPPPDHSPAPVQGPHVVDYTAGQDTTTSPTTAAPTTATTARTDREVGGLRIVAVDDPSNPARTHIRVVDPHRKRTG